MLAGGESAASTVGRVHEVNAQDGHGAIVPYRVVVCTSSISRSLQ
jgi:hypothetical protein